MGTHDDKASGSDATLMVYVDPDLREGRPGFAMPANEDATKDTPEDPPITAPPVDGAQPDDPGNGGQQGEKRMPEAVAGANAQTANAGVASATDQIGRSDATTQRDVRFNQDIGADEGQVRGLYNDTEKWSANNKRTYDEYQDLGLNAARRGQSFYDRMASNGLDFDVQVRQLSVQALQNAVETANMIGKQAVRHNDISMDRQWNVDEVSTMTAKTGPQLDAIIAAMAAAIAEAINKKS